MSEEKTVVLLQENGRRGVCKNDCRKEESIFTDVIILSPDGIMRIEKTEHCFSCLKDDVFVVGRMLMMCGLQLGKYILVQPVEKAIRNGAIVCCSEYESLLGLNFLPRQMLVQGYLYPCQKCGNMYFEPFSKE